MGPRARSCVQSWLELELEDAGIVTSDEVQLKMWYGVAYSRQKWYGKCHTSHTASTALVCG